MKKTLARGLGVGLGILLIGMLSSEAALAGGRHHHGHGRLSIGLHFGVPLAWQAWPPYWYYPPPVVYAPVVVPSSPPVYMERNDPPASDGGWWYYCEATRGYYPYVKECPQGWQKVPPAPQ